MKKPLAQSSVPLTQDLAPDLAPDLGKEFAQEFIQEFKNSTLAVFANREPYVHHRRGNEIQVIRPASGLVTALEPILRSCGGLWIAHGSGNADRETADTDGLLAVPPEQPSYRLKRIWLSEEEEQGYYYGFANEGLWPLCHLAHTRPTFRLTDWTRYQAVNQRFCDETDLSGLGPNPLFLIQDYHFAVLPRLLRQRLEQSSLQKIAPIGVFWHIPWPSPETFGICPWKKELLEGMLGADLIAFHTQHYCNNFLETCARYLEARVDWENFSVTLGRHETRIRAFPIGISTPPVRELNSDERVRLRKQYGIHARWVAVGVDRIDYTKGLLERVDAVERFLEKYPTYIGHFTWAQIASPSRMHIPTYQNFSRDFLQAIQRVNQRYGREDSAGAYRPIVLLTDHHEWSDLQYFYQLGDLCLVTSLHDGMNLVAKEYVWCQNPRRGALVLSQFAGASRELSGALLINPYSIEEMADAIRNALELTPFERARRMNSMRTQIENHTAFDWARELIRSLASGRAA